MKLVLAAALGCTMLLHCRIFKEVIWLSLKVLQGPLPPHQVENQGRKNNYTLAIFLLLYLLSFPRSSLCLSIVSSCSAVIVFSLLTQIFHSAVL